MKQFLTTDTVSAATVRRLSRFLGVHPWPNPMHPCIDVAAPKLPPQPIHLISNDITEQNLKKLFKLPVCSIIDSQAQKKSISAFLNPKKTPLHTSCLGILLTSPHIYRCDIAQLLTQALYDRLHFSPPYFEAIRMVLHESVVNALIHGNLQLPSGLRQSARECIEYSHLLKNRLNHPTFSKKSIHIWACWSHRHLEIKIKDEGIGYRTPVTPCTEQTSSATTGRGLHIIAGIADSCTISDSGRELRLSFLLTDKSASWHTAVLNQSEQRVLTPDLSKSRILIIEKNIVGCLLLNNLLNTMGIFQIQTTLNKTAGFKKLLSDPFDLILINLKNAAVSGYNFLKKLRKTPKISHIPVLVQTPDTASAQTRLLFEAGATDIISSPLNPLEFFSRIKTHLENQILTTQLSTQIKTFESELQTAQNMQIQILPSPKQLSDIKNRFCLDIASYFIPSSGLGGDFWHVFEISKTQLGVCLSDFSGHGIAAALNTFRLHTLITQINKKSIQNPADFLHILNSRLYDLLPRGQFTTFFFCIIDTDKNTLHYTGAGSVSPVLKNRTHTYQLATSGIPLGIAHNPHYTTQKVPFVTGDLLLLFSDALIEAKLKDGTLWGYKRFVKKAHSFFNISDPQFMLDKIMAHFFQLNPPPPDDDVTIIAIKHT